MTRDQQEGPPWGTTVDPDEAYLRGQAGQAGSGLLGGWSQASYGGAFDARTGKEKAIRREVVELAAKARAQAEPDLTRSR